VTSMLGEPALTKPNKMSRRQLDKTNKAISHKRLISLPRPADMFGCADMDKSL